MERKVYDKSSKILGSLSNNDGDGNGNGYKNVT